MAAVNSKQREKVLWIITVTVAFLWAWKLFVLTPISQYRDKLDAELGAKNIKLREARMTLSATPHSAQESLKRFTSEGSGQEDMARMIKDLEAAAAGSGLRVLETKPQPQTNNVGWFELKVSLVFEGSWSDVVRFMYQLESVDKPLLVNEMSLEANLPQQSSIRGRLEIGRFLTDSP
jgi:Tfp pilus assembly protein PilO